MQTSRWHGMVRGVTHTAASLFTKEGYMYIWYMQIAELCSRKGGGTIVHGMDQIHVHCTCTVHES